MTTLTTRPVALGAVLTTLVVLAAACGGTPVHNGVASLGKTTTTAQSSALPASSLSGSSGPSQAQALKYAKCMRSHGLSDFPDPSVMPNGGIGFSLQGGPGSDLNPSSPQFQSAKQACQKDVPRGLARTPAQMEAAALMYTECMRSHGEPDFPDPNGQGLIQVTNPTGIMDPNSPQFQRAQTACQKLDNGFPESMTARSPGGPGPGGGPAAT
ncbi:MAG: hypothetical protein ACLQVK_12840 [Acidimicrobiales bacterium]